MPNPEVVPQTGRTAPQKFSSLTKRLMDSLKLSDEVKDNLRKTGMDEGQVRQLLLKSRPDELEKRFGSPRASLGRIKTGDLID
jgi:hypothetical protein